MGFCFAVLVTLAGIKFFQIKSAVEFAASLPEAMETVEFSQVRETTWAPETTVIAETVAIHAIELRNELSGVIESVHFEPGEAVSKGQLLISQEANQEKAKLASIRADIKLAEAEYQRALSIVAKGAAPASTKDQREAERDALLADEQELIATINKKSIHAPFDATTGLHELDVGQYLNPGTFLTHLVGTNEEIWVDFSLPQQMAGLVVGDSVQFSAENVYRGKRAATIIARDAIANSLSRSVRFRAKISNEDEALFPGMALTAHVPTSKSVHGFTVPASAIRYHTSGPYVFVLARIQNSERGTHRAVKRPISIHGERDGQVLVTYGLETGDEVATLGSFKLRENILVNAISPNMDSGTEASNQSAAIGH